MQLLKGSKAMTLYIKNWNKHQHFKDRTPPWIKLYRDILDDPDWHDLDGETAKTLIGLWLIASEDESHKGALPSIRKLAFRLRISESQLNQMLTKLSQWLYSDDIETISDRHRSDALETETETEREKEGEKEAEKKTQRGTRLPADCLLPPEWADFCKHQRPDLVPRQVFDEFRDYWIAQPGQKGVKTDWDATWRNWVRRQNAPKTNSARPVIDIDARNREAKRLLGFDEETINA
jgi:hypothetical protein